MKNLLACGILFGLILGCGEPKEKSNNSNESPEVESEEMVEESRKTILFYGNSITAGYMLDMEEAFPAIIQNRLDSLGYEYRVVNAGLSGETTASGKSRVDWVLRTTPDIFVLELGANDALRGLPLSETIKNLKEIIDLVKKENPEVKIIVAGMEAPPNLGQDYTQEFRSIFPTIAFHYDATLIPFLLDKVAGEPDLNLEDGIHPTPEGHKILAETVWKYLEPLLEKPENI